MGKFVYEKEEIHIAKTQCELCRHWVAEKPEACIYYEVKPEEILDNRAGCPYFTTNREMPWDAYAETLITSE